MKKKNPEERNAGIRRYFLNLEERKMVNAQHARFPRSMGVFGTFDSFADRWRIVKSLEPLIWWYVQASSSPMLLKQPSSFSDNLVHHLVLRGIGYIFLLTPMEEEQSDSKTYRRFNVYILIFKF